jgi:hypothetical protein
MIERYLLGKIAPAGEDLGEMAYNWLAPLEISQMQTEKDNF